MTTTIAWTGETWNPIKARDRETGKRGWFCVLKSPGCFHCYAQAMNLWTGNHHRYIAGEAEKVDIFVDDVALTFPLRLTKPEMIFPCSMTDLFLDQHADEMIASVYAVMALARQHTFQLLTKRPERMLELTTSMAFREMVQFRIDHLAMELTDPLDRRTDDLRATAPDVVPSDDYQGLWPLPNVWHGISVEDQKRADERLHVVVQVPSVVHWVSYEPAIGPVDFRDALNGYPRQTSQRQIVTRDMARDAGDMALEGQPYSDDEWEQTTPAIDWIVVGGESGPGARPFDLEWAQSVVDQCRAAGKHPFVKQMGSVYAKANKLADKKGEDPSEWPILLQVREYPPTAAQRIAANFADGFADLF